MKRKTYLILMLSFLIAGLCVLLYPTVSDYVNTYHYMETADQYVESSEMLPDIIYKEEIEAVKQYNDWLAEFSSLEQAVAAEKADEDNIYERLLNLDHDGVMGVVSIPDKNVYLPIYHGTEEQELQKGVGHYRGSSFPIGGEGTHAVLTGHTGLTSAKMFTDLDTMKEGDTFYIYVLGHTLKYQVDNISVVNPEEVEKLSIKQGKDYVTLVTCTPYGVNSHRLLIRGIRVPYVEEIDFKSQVDVHEGQRKMILGLIIAGAIVISFSFGMYIGRRMEKQKIVQNKYEKDRDINESKESS